MFKISIRRKLWLVVLTLPAAITTGCTQTLSKYPLSNGETSVIDERLIGYWQLVKFQNRDEPNLPLFVVGRVKGNENILEVVATRLTKNNQVKVSRRSVFTQTIGDKKYVSLRTPHNDEVSYTIFKYQLTDPGTGNCDSTELKLFAMNSDFVGRAISEQKLAGKVNWYESPDKPDAKAAWVRTTASPKQLTAFIQEHPQELFKKAPVIVLKRFQPGWQKKHAR